MPARDQFRAKAAVVVDLPIEGYPDALVFVREGLMPPRHIDDAQPAVAETQFPIEIKALVIGPAMSHGVGRPLEVDWVHRGSSSVVVNAANSAHRIKAPATRHPPRRQAAITRRENRSRSREKASEKGSWSGGEGRNGRRAETRNLRSNSQS